MTLTDEQANKEFTEAMRDLSTMSNADRRALLSARKPQPTPKLAPERSTSPTVADKIALARQRITNKPRSKRFNFALLKKRGITAKQSRGLANFLLPTRPAQPRIRRVRRVIANEGNKRLSNLNYRDIESYHDQQRALDLIKNKAQNQQLSEGTKRILDNLRNTQTLADRNKNQMARIHRERRAIAAASNLLKTPNIFKEQTFNPLLRDEFDILSAPNVFKEQPDNNILRKRKNSFSILDTVGSNNNLKW